MSTSDVLALLSLIIALLSLAVASIVAFRQVRLEEKNKFLADRFISGEIRRNNFALLTLTSTLKGLSGDFGNTSNDENYYVSRVSGLPRPFLRRDKYDVLKAESSTDRSTLLEVGELYEIYEAIENYIDDIRALNNDPEKLKSIGRGKWEEVMFNRQNCLWMAAEILYSKK